MNENEMIFTKATNTIQTRSTHYFATPSEQTKAILFYRDMFGHFACDNRYRVERPAFDSYLLMYTLEGTGTIITPRGKSICRKNDIALIDCNKEHKYYADDFWEFMWFHFNGSASHQIVDFILARQGTVSHAAETWLSFQCFRDLTEKQLPSSLAGEITISAHIHRILAELAMYEPSGKNRSHRTEIANKALQLIDRHYSKALSILDIAEQLGVSKSSLCHIFKAETGFSPYDYIITKRIDQAKYLLRKMDLTISEISYQIGFQSESHFTKTFRERVGMSPTEFRRSSSFDKSKNK